MKIKISALDKKFSYYIRWIRDKGKCQRCGKEYKPPTSALHCSHFWGRARKSTRFSVDNCCSLCYGCHMHMTAQPQEHRDFMLKRLGQLRYDCLMVEANSPNRPDYEGIRIWLEMEINNGKEKVIGGKILP